MSSVQVSRHPLVQSWLARLRDRATPPPEFRRLVRGLAQMMGQEAMADLPTRPHRVETPLGPCDSTSIDAEIAIVPILRAGLGMAEGLLELIPEARVSHIGLFRDEATLQPTTYYQRLQTARSSSIAFVVDPMLATGGSAIAACRLVCEAGFERIKLIALIAAPEGVAALGRAFPDVAIHVAAIDERLTERGFIYPGLGDAGDRQFGT